jgi:hypothetical protein
MDPGKKVVVFRFAARVARAWYKDPKEAAWMTASGIALRDLQVKYLPIKLLLAARKYEIGAEDALTDFVEDGAGWEDCGKSGWNTTITLKARLDGLMMM